MMTAQTTAHPIEVRGLTKRFGSLSAVDHLDLTVRAGSVHGFLGPNGAGKSTTIRVLLGMYRRDGGQVSVLGRDPSAHAAAINRNLAYLPGDVALWPNLTGGQVLDAIGALRGRRDRRRERDLVERFNLDPTKKVRTYSKGNRQKVALIAALAAPVDLFVLDEPTSGLDPLMERVFTEVVSTLRERGASVLLSSHILAEVQELCTRVTIIKDGRVVEDGDLEHLRSLAETRIRLCVPEARTRAELRSRLASLGIAVREDGEHLSAQVGADAVPIVLGLAVRERLSDVRAEAASLEDLFLRHYEGVAASSIASPGPAEPDAECPR